MPPDGVRSPSLGINVSLAGSPAPAAYVPFPIRFRIKFWLFTLDTFDFLSVALSHAHPDLSL
jgi:hypothetical protein